MYHTFFLHFVYIIFERKVIRQTRKITVKNTSFSAISLLICMFAIKSFCFIFFLMFLESLLNKNEKYINKLSLILIIIAVADDMW